MYHSVINEPVPGEALSYSGVGKGDFEWQIRYLIKNYRLISLGEYIQSRHNGHTVPSSSAIITFDDGYRGVYTTAYPILQRYSVPATVFVCTGSVENGTLQWDAKVDHLINSTQVQDLELEMEIPCHFDLSTCDQKIAATYEIQRRLSRLAEQQRQQAMHQLETKLATQKGQMSPNLLPLTWDQLKVMSDNGISIGSHTLSHPNLTKVSRAQAQQEIGHSKEMIESETGRPVDFFSYPFGIFNAEVKAMVRTPYQGAVALAQGVSRNSVYCMRRVGIYGPNTRIEFIAKLSVLEPLLFKGAELLRTIRHQWK